MLHEWMPASRLPPDVYKRQEYVRAVRHAIGHDIMLMADFNACYSQAVARRIIRELEPEDVYKRQE